MVQFAVHKNRNARTKVDVPFLLDVQADVLSILATRVVVPLYRLEASGPKPMARLTPVVRFQEKTLVAMVPELAGVARAALGPAVGDLAGSRTEIIQAMDLLLTGF
jgi:toxin CcdB